MGWRGCAKRGEMPFRLRRRHWAPLFVFHKHIPSLLPPAAVQRKCAAMPASAGAPGTAAGPATMTSGGGRADRL
eukprot:9485704-Pyramimonas_sp.AAC.1